MLIGSPAENKSDLKDNSLTPGRSGINSLHFFTTWSVLIVRVSDGASSNATSAILEPAKLAFKLPGPLEVLVSIGKYPIVDNLFFIIFSLGKSDRSWFSKRVAAFSSFSKPSLVTSRGVPEAYSIVAIAKSSSTAGKKRILKSH